MPDPLLKFRRIHYTDANDASKKRAYLPATKPASDASDDGHSDANEDLYLGGGGLGSLALMTLVSYNQSAAHGDYLVCTDDSAVSHNVAVQPELQSSIASQTIGSETWDYTGYGSSGQERTATLNGVGLVEPQVITPRFLAGDRIPVFSCSNTGVTVGGTALTLIAITGREWAAKYQPVA